MKGLTLNTKAERIQFLDGNEGGEEGTALALSAEYLRSENVKATSRYELRLGKQETTNLFDLGAAIKVADGLSLLPKVSLWHSDKIQGTDSLYEGLVGIAYRPKGYQSIYLLDSLRFKFERAGSTGTKIERKSLITSTEASFRVSAKWLLTGKYAGKYSWETGEGNTFTSYTDLLLAGATYDVTDRWDVGIMGKLMNQYDTGMHSIGAVVKTGYRVWRNLYAGVGYNLSRLNDSDLSGSSYRSHGPFLELKVKFDEETLKGLKESAGRKAQTPPPVSLRPPAPPADNVVAKNEMVEPPVPVRGSVENLSLVVKGVSVPLPASDVTMRSEALFDVVEIRGGPAGWPVRFESELSPAGVPRRWRLDVTTAKGEVVRVLSGEGAPPGVIPWDGRTEEGEQVNAGERYRYQMEVVYADGSRSTSALRAFAVNGPETFHLGLAIDAFRFDSAELSPRARRALAEVAGILNRFPDGKVVVEGHADSTGPAEYNLGLSKRRAEAARDYLVEAGGIPADRFVLQPYGEIMPVAPNETAEGRERNRRVELKGEVSEPMSIGAGEMPRTDPVVRIGRSPVEVDPQGRFTSHVPAGTDGIEVEIRNGDGRSVRTRVAMPSR